MSTAQEPVGTEPPEPPGVSIAQTVEDLQRRVLGDLDEVLGVTAEAATVPARTETPD